MRNCARCALKAAVLLAVATGVAAISGCGGEEETPAGEGRLSVEIWGEEFIEQGIGAEVFSDGWAVQFDTFLVAVDGVTSGRGAAAPDLVDDTQRIFDLTQAGPTLLGSGVVPAGRYDHTDYRVGPATGAAVAGNATAAQVALMTDSGYSVYAAGSATRGAQTKTFRWGFASDTRYVACESTAELVDGGEATVQLTIHADHLFYDDLFAEDPAVTFDVPASADANGDGEVTQAELGAFDLTALANYGTGSTGVEDLGAFVAQLTATLGHIDGEGHCHTEAAAE